MKKIILIAGMLFAAFITSVSPVSADKDGSAAHYLRASERLFNRYIECFENQSSCPDILLRASSRAVRRNQNLARYAALSSPRERALRERINQLKKNIRNKKRRAQEMMAINIVRGLELLNEVAEMELRLQHLREQLEYGECGGNKGKVRMVFENNSSYAIGVYLRDTANMGHLVGSLPAEKITALVVPVSTIRSLIGEEKTVGIVLYTRINLKDIFVDRRFSLKNMPKDKPCVLNVKWELFDKTFPVPPSKYLVYGVDAGPNLFVGTIEAISKRTRCSFLNGGRDCETYVVYQPLSGEFATYEAAQQALCGMIQQHVHWNLYAPCQERFMVGGNWYWGCESSVQGAISAYCPQFK